MATFAQNKSQQNIVQYLTESTDSTVRIDLSPSLKNEFMSDPSEKEVQQPGKQSDANTEVSRPAIRKDTPHKKVAVRTRGYRIQIFGDGRNQNTLQARARARAKKILTRFPKYNHQVYSFSKAPNYYTRIGNFATRSEANAALIQLRRAFPDFAGEMRVVSSEVIINR